MKNKTQSRLITLVVIVVVFSLILILQQQWSTIFPTRVEKPFSTFDKSQITNITLNTGTSKIELYKKNGKFYLRKDGIEFAADQSRIDQLVSAITAFKKTDPISTNKAKHKQFGIDKQAVALKTKDQTLTVYIGNAPLPDQNYIRFDQQNEVYVATGFDTALSPADYRDLNIKAITTESKVTSFSEQYDDVNLTLEKKGKDWYSGNDKVKKERVDFLINDLKTMKANDIILPKDISLEEPELTIQIKEDGKERSLAFSKKDDSTYYLKQNGSNYLYVVAVANIQSLKKQLTDFTQ